MAGLSIFLAFNWKEGAIVEKLEEKKLGNYARAPAFLRPSRRRRREEEDIGGALSPACCRAVSLQKGTNQPATRMSLNRSQRSCRSTKYGTQAKT